MKAVRTVALSRLSAAPFVPVTESETLRLRQLPAWQRWLYVELVGLADFKTGAGRASYPQLAALLDFDAMPGRPPQGARVSLDQIRRAVDALGALGLVLRDKLRNEIDGILNFVVATRAGFATPARTSARGSRRGATAPRARKGGPSPVTPATVTRAITPGVSREKELPLTPETVTLSTDADAAAARAKLAVSRAEIVEAAGGRIEGPRGGQTLAPCGGTPPACGPASPLGDASVPDQPLQVTVTRSNPIRFPEGESAKAGADGLQQQHASNGLEQGRAAPMQAAGYLRT